MRLHIVGLPWTETTREFSTCAYTQKLVKAGKMLLKEGHEVIVYSGQENDTECTEHVPIFTRPERIAWFGEHDQNSTWAHVSWDPNHESWRAIAERALREILVRAQPQDLLLLIAGAAQKPLADALPELLACEPFVGYKGILTDRCAFESHAWRHHVYGLNGIEHGRFFDTVIPNYFDPDDFRGSGRRGDALLFMGRMIEAKGPHVAVSVASAAGRELYFCGPGVREVETVDGVGLRIYGDGIVVEGQHLHYLGVLGPEDRAAVMHEAAALIAPTLYIEPFGGVAVEAMLCGTPVVATDFGAFTETIEEGVGGYLFSTLAEAVEAVELATRLNRERVAEYARRRYSLDAVGPRFTHWFRRLDTLWDEGWYTPPAKEVFVA